MSLTLHVDAARFRANQHRVLALAPEVVPVAKGNGYGLGNERLASEAANLGVDTLAVGTYAELPAVSEHFPGSLLVLTPWHAFEAPEAPNRRIIHTIGRLEDLHGLLARDPDARFVLERMTSMLRHGFSARDLRAAGDWIDEHGPAAGQFEGVAFHLPMTGASHLSEVQRLMTDAVAAGLPPTTIWVSHLTDAELANLGRSWPDYTIRPRIGTQLWLGDREAFSVRATVLDSHAIERGDIFGYRGRSAPKPGTILVVSGGTAHGIGLEAPTGANTIKARAGAIARGGMDAAGFVRSPYSIGGKQRLFAEPPHMQASMLFVPAGSPVPGIGEEIDVRVRYTATCFDRVLLT